MNAKLDFPPGKAILLQVQGDNGSTVTISAPNLAALLADAKEVLAEVQPIMALLPKKP